MERAIFEELQVGEAGSFLGTSMHLIFIKSSYRRCSQQIMPTVQQGKMSSVSGNNLHIGYSVISTPQPTIVGTPIFCFAMARRTSKLRRIDRLMVGKSERLVGMMLGNIVQGFCFK